ncbi:MAG TPA: family 16 glycosylhydrolase, partial [Arenibaculum sp.]|nr:family 16 glycosylhydrolase [Arenibaculum sp.]
DGWSNGDYVGSDWRSSQVQPRDGVVSLVLDANPDAEKGFSSGEIQTHAFFEHGYFEARLQAAKGNGIVTGFFTYTGPTFGDPWDEIDIEILGRNTRQVQFNYFTDGVTAEPVTMDLPFDAAEGLHTYAFEWLPDRINWYVDGELMHSEDGTDNLALPENPQKLYIGMWNGRGLDDWLGTFRWKGEPLVAKVGCVSYQTERGSGPSCSTAESAER